MLNYELRLSYTALRREFGESGFTIQGNCMRQAEAENALKAYEFSGLKSPNLVSFVYRVVDILSPVLTPALHVFRLT